MAKPFVVVSCPVDTFSGYGARSRDIVKALFKTGKYDIKILSQRWGNTPYGALNPDVPEEKQSNLVATDDSAMKYAFSNMDKYNVVVQRASVANTKIAKALAKYLKNKPMDVTTFEHFSFSSNKLKFVKPPKAMGTSGFKSYTDLINNEIAESTKGTAYRKNAFRTITWAIYCDKGYGNPTPTTPLTEKEIFLTLTSLNSLIDSIYQFENFKELPQVYGLMCSEYLKRYGKKQVYNKLSRKVQGFLNLHGNMYI